MKSIIIDNATNEYYCVNEDAKSFPFWSTDKNDAHVFGSELLAKHEMDCYDFPAHCEVVPFEKGAKNTSERNAHVHPVLRGIINNF